MHDILTLFLVTQTRATNIPLFLIFVIQQGLLGKSLPKCHIHQVLTVSASQDLSAPQTTMTTVILTMVSFFALGNSNAISSIELGNAYNGISSYNVIGVGVLIFASNWAGPIFWASAGVLRLLPQDEAQAEPPPTTVQPGDKSKSWIQAEHERLHRSVKEGPKSLSPEQVVPNKDEEEEEDVPSPIFIHIALLTLFTTSALFAVMFACTILRTHLFIWTVFSPKYLYAMAWSLLHHLVINIGLSSLLWWLASP